MKTFYDQENFIRQLSIDCVVFGYEKSQLKVLVTKLDLEGNLYSLPGGFIHQNEDIDKAAFRILKTRTGIDQIYLEQFKVYGKADRKNESVTKQLRSSNQQKLRDMGFDQGTIELLSSRFISIGYYALVDIRKVQPTKSRYDQEISWRDVQALPKMIIDHNQMVVDALHTLRFHFDSKLMGFNLLPETFTMRQLRELYEAVYQKPFPNNNFQKKILGLNILDRIGKKYTGAKNKAPFVYRFKEDPSTVLAN